MSTSRFVFASLLALAAATALAGCLSHSEDDPPEVQAAAPRAAAPATNGHPESAPPRKPVALKPAPADPSAAAAPADPPDAPRKIQWLNDWDAAKKAAGRSGKLIMADFYTDWCGWCKKLDRVTYTDRKIIRLVHEFVPLKLNADKAGRKLARKNGVRGYPTILFFDKNGKVVGRIAGYLSPVKYAKAVREIQKKNRPAPPKA